MSPQEIDEQKYIQYYAAGVAAWYNTSLEHDKSIFALSAGGIGLLITLLTSVGIGSSLLLHLYIGAILCFLVSLVCVLIVFRRNKDHIEQVLGNQSAAPDAMLRNLDLAALVAFGVGACCAALIGISHAVSSFESKVKTMTTENKPQTSAPTPALESFSGIQGLRPQTEFTKSFNGVASLQPQGSPATSVPPTPIASAPVPSPAPKNPNSGK